MKRFFLAIVFLCVSLGAYTHTGIMAGERNIQYLETKWFTIIFPEKSALEASFLALHADFIYEELCTLCNISERFRMPVVLSAASDYANAYYAGAPYNHIVIIDTVPPSSASAEDYILNTFTHELSHAITYNHVSSSWSFLRRLFCNGLSLSPLTVPGFLSEGAAVSLESAKENEGRLHDGFFLHTIRQAKLQETFPRYTDITGSRDVYPKDVHYSFGAPFCGYLQEVYGMERYMLWWYACLNTDSSFSKNRWHLHTCEGYFKSVYGIPLYKAWADFVQNIQVPLVSKNPQEEGLEKALQADFRYAHIAWSKKGIAFADAQTSAVYFAPFKKDGGLSSPKKLFVCPNVNSLHVSSDGRFLAVGFFAQNSVNYKNRTSVYDLQYKRWTCVKNEILKNATPVFCNGKYFLCGLKTESQKETLCIYSLPLKEKSQCAEKLVQEKNVLLPQNIFLLDLCDSGTGSLASIAKEGLTWSVLLSSTLENAGGISWEVYTVPEYTHIRNINAGLDANGCSVLTFSWAKKETFPRAGKITLENGQAKELWLEEKNCSGGVYFPVLNNGTLYFAGNFVWHTDFLAKKNASFKSETFGSVKISMEENFAEPGANGFFTKAVLSASKPYKNWYNPRGALVPLALLPQQDENGNVKGLPVALGATWVTSNAWDSDFFAVSSGYDIFSKTAGAALLFTGNTGVFGQNVYSYSVRPAIFVNERGFKNATLDASANVSLKSAFGTFSFGANTFWFFNGNLEMFNTEKLSASFSTVRKTGPGYYEKSGIAFSVTYQFFLKDECAHILSPQVTFQVPRLLPLKNHSGFTYNLPVKLTLSLTPSSTKLVEANAQAVLFAKEIQHGLLYVPLFFNRIEGSLLYSAHFAHKNASWELFNVPDDFCKLEKNMFYDSLQIKVSLTGTVNTGLLCNAPLTLGIGAGFRPHKKENQNTWFVSFTSSTLF